MVSFLTSYMTSKGTLKREPPSISALFHGLFKPSCPRLSPTFRFRISCIFLSAIQNEAHQQEECCERFRGIVLLGTRFAAVCNPTQINRPDHSPTRVCLVNPSSHRAFVTPTLNYRYRRYNLSRDSIAALTAPLSASLNKPVEEKKKEGLGEGGDEWMSGGRSPERRKLFHPDRPFSSVCPSSWEMYPL